MWWQSLIGALGALALTWTLLVIYLLVHRPAGEPLRELVRLLPDTVRLIARLARDSSLPRGVRLRLLLLLGYLALPIDLIPDFIPVLGYADDAILIALVLRTVLRRTSAGPITHHWPGTANGLEQLLPLLKLSQPPS